jgi:hypothetical protein
VVAPTAGRPLGVILVKSAHDLVRLTTPARGRLFLAAAISCTRSEVQGGAAPDGIEICYQCPRGVLRLPANRRARISGSAGTSQRIGEHRVRFDESLLDVIFGQGEEAFPGAPAGGPRSRRESCPKPEESHPERGCERGRRRDHPVHRARTDGAIRPAGVNDPERIMDDTRQVVRLTALPQAKPANGFLTGPGLPGYDALRHCRLWVAAVGTCGNPGGSGSSARPVRAVPDRPRGT